MSRTTHSLAARRGTLDAHPLDVRSLSSFSPAQQRLLRTLIEADRPRPERGPGGAASRVTR